MIMSDRVFTKADLNEIVRCMIKEVCKNTPRDSKLPALQYTVAYLDGVNKLADNICNFLEGKEKK